MRIRKSNIKPELILELEDLIVDNPGLRIKLDIGVVESGKITRITKRSSLDEKCNYR